VRAASEGWRERAIDWIADHPMSVPGRLAARRFGRPPRDAALDVVAAPDSERSLLIAPANFAGQAHAWCRSVERADPTVAARNYAVETGAFVFPADAVVTRAAFHNSRTWQAAQERVAEGFSHMIVESFIPPFGRRHGRDFERQLDALRPGVELALMCHGTDIRRPSLSRQRTPLSPFHEDSHAARRLEVLVDRHLALIDRLALPVFVSTPDLLQDVPEATWCPVVVDPGRWTMERPDRTGRLRVMHAPSKASAKGTSVIEPVLTRLADEGVIDYRPLRGVPHSDMPAMLARADVVVDQLSVGSYGVAACEAMAAGCVVVSHVTPQVRAIVEARTGEALPIIEGDRDSLEGAIRALADDSGAVAEAAGRGRPFVERVHSGVRSAGEILRWMHGAADAATT
jgi:hypothetical protein